MFRIIVLFALFASINCHNWMTSPTSRDGNQASTTVPCDGTTPVSPPTDVPSGQPYTVSWTVNHPTDSATYDLYLVQAGQESTLESQTPSSPSFISSSPSSVGSATVTFDPTQFPPGDYVLQFRWSSWRNCADIKLVLSPPPGAVEQADGSWRLGDGHGSWNPTTDTITCDPGYTLSGNDCVASSGGGLSGGAVFGIFLLVLVLVGIVGVVGVMVFLKIKKPLVYRAVMTASKRKFDHVKNKITHRDG